MSIVIQKYGGTSVGSVERMRHVCDLIIAEQQRGNRVVVVVSAMAGETNRLVNLASQFNNSDNSKAHDFLVATGESVSCGMLALALNERGVEASPLAGWQVPVYTTESAGRATIESIESSKINALLTKGIVPVITGFQGVSKSCVLTTLGRGGSDTSAAALAANLKADRCDIYTDIDGVYTADPRIVANASHMPCVPFDVALSMAKLGAKVIHPKAVECAMQANVNLRVLSSFGSSQYTLVNSSETSCCAITHVEDNYVFTVSGFGGANTPDQLLLNLVEQDIFVDVWQHSELELVFSVVASDTALVQRMLTELRLNVVIMQRGSKVSVVGNNISVNVQEEVLSLFNERSIVHLASVANGNRVSVLVQQNQLTPAVNVLHATFLEKLTKKD